MMKRAAASLCCILALLLVADAQTITPGGGGGGGTPPGGVPTNLQYNVDGVNFGGVAGSSWDGITFGLPNLNTGAGVITGGTYNGVGIVASGANQGTLTVGGTNVIFGQSGTLGTAAFQNIGTSGANLGFLNGNNTHSGTSAFSGATTVSVAGGASTPGTIWTGTVFTGGSGTTTFPHLFLQPTGTSAVTTWNTSGTEIGINATSGFLGNFLDFRIGGGVTIFTMNAAGTLSTPQYILSGTSGNLTLLNGTSQFAITNAGATTGILTSNGTNTISIGAKDAASPAAQGLSVQNVVAGTSNVAGQTFTVTGSRSTGSGVSGDVAFATGGTGAGATAQNTAVNGLIIKGATQILQPGRGYTVSALPACSGTTFGWSFVTDATAPTYRGALIGGGAVITPVFCDTTSWTSH